MSVSTHVLDTGRGRPAAGVTVRLERLVAGAWEPVGDGVTDDDGRVARLATDTGAGVHRLTFDTAAHSDFYPEVSVTFTIAEPAEHHHVPLLLSPFAYSTYRGS
ncbi:MAG TPA: hydroxyisourate hydrolase [Pseudonocardiaceae bacterium]